MPLHSEEIPASASPWAATLDGSPHISPRTTQASLQPHPSGMFLLLPSGPLQACTGSSCWRALQQLLPAYLSQTFSECFRTAQFRPPGTQELIANTSNSSRGGQGWWSLRRQVHLKAQMCTAGPHTSLFHSREKITLEGGQKAPGPQPKRSLIQEIICRQGMAS